MVVTILTYDFFLFLNNTKFASTEMYCLKFPVKKNKNELIENVTRNVVICNVEMLQIGNIKCHKLSQPGVGSVIKSWL